MRACLTSGRREAPVEKLAIGVALTVAIRAQTKRACAGLLMNLSAVLVSFMSRRSPVCLNVPAEFADKYASKQAVRDNL